MQRNAVRYRLSHACFARHDAVPSAEDSPCCRAGARRLRAQGIQRRATAMTLPELAEATGLSKSSVQRFTHTLWTLGYLRRSRQQEVLAGTLVAGTGHEVRADQSAGAGRQSVPSIRSTATARKPAAWPSPTAWTWCTWRFATHKEMFVNMPVGMRLPLYCTAAGAQCCRGWIRTWPTGCWSAATVDPIPPPRSPAWTPCWLSWSSRAGTAMHVPMASSTRATSPSAPPCWMPAASPGRGQCVGSIQPLVVRTGAGRVWSAGGRNRACHQRVAHLGTFLSLLRAGARRRLRATPISVRRSLISVRRTAGPRRRGGPPSGACAAYSILF